MMMMSKTLIRNAIRTPDGTLVESHSRHDYVTYIDTRTGHTYMVDGGLDYCRRSGYEDQIDECVYMEDGHAKVRAALTWGTYGKTGLEPFRRVTLAHMSTSHIQAILNTLESQLYPQIKTSFENELEYRLAWGNIYSHLNNDVEFMSMAEAMAEIAHLRKIFKEAAEYLDVDRVISAGSSFHDEFSDEGDK
jgi:hypothetical protein